MVSKKTPRPESARTAHVLWARKAYGARRAGSGRRGELLEPDRRWNRRQIGVELGCRFLGVQVELRVNDGRGIEDFLQPLLVHQVWNCLFRVHISRVP